MKSDSIGLIVFIVGTMTVFCLVNYFFPTKESLQILDSKDDFSEIVSYDYISNRHYQITKKINTKLYLLGVDGKEIGWLRSQPVECGFFRTELKTNAFDFAKVNGVAPATQPIAITYTDDEKLYKILDLIEKVIDRQKQ